MSHRLRVRLHDRPVGWLIQKDNGNLQFRYDDTYVTDRGPALSVSLPLRGEAYGHRACLAFFGGVLPEADVRSAAAAQLGVSVHNDFRLLDELGGDCAGAIELRAEDVTLDDASRAFGMTKLDAAQLDHVLRALPTRPVIADPADGAWLRMSLAGAQGKLPVLHARDGVALPADSSTPSTHIIKPEPARFPGLVAVEAFCMRLAHEVGLDVAHVETAHTQSGLPYLDVTRFDRVAEGSGVIRRMHQEDLCQALGRIPAQKYQSEGGPSLAECADLLRATTAAPARDLLRLWDAVVFNVLIGNCDAHGKNFSLLYDPDGPRLAPLYDLVSTTCWPELSRRLAMRIGDAVMIDDVTAGSFQSAAGDLGLNPRQALVRAHTLAQHVTRSALGLSETLAPPADSPVTQIIAGIKQRADALTAS